MKMSAFVTAGAKRDQTHFGIFAQPAARSEVVYLKIMRRAIILAAPPITREYRAGELAVGFGFKT
jgi:hypothetical protein